MRAPLATASHVLLFKTLMHVAAHRLGPAVPHKALHQQQQRLFVFA